MKDTSEDPKTKGRTDEVDARLMTAKPNLIDRFQRFNGTTVYLIDEADAGPDGRAKPDDG